MRFSITSAVVVMAGPIADGSAFIVGTFVTPAVPITSKPSLLGKAYVRLGLKVSHLSRSRFGEVKSNLGTAVEMEEDLIICFIEDSYGGLNNAL